MLTRHLAAAVMAAALATGSAATAADLSDGYPEKRYGSAYDDPRYAEIYRDDQPPRRETYADKETYRADRDDDDDDDDDRGPRYAHRDQGYLPPMKSQPRYAYGRGHRGDGCVPRHLIKQQLRAEGWSDFHDLELAGSTAHVRARRPSGRLFELKVDRCTGEIVNARPFGPNLYGSRRYSRAY